MKKEHSESGAQNMGRVIAVIVLILGAGAGIYFSVFGFPKLPWQASEPEVIETTPLRTVDLSHLNLEVVDTYETRQLGLGGRESLDDDAGMLFVFPTSDRYSFWMKGMQFPIDIIWISNQVVVDVVTLSPPYPGLPIPPSHRPKEAADLVLELNAGKAAELGIEEGVGVEF